MNGVNRYSRRQNSALPCARVVDIGAGGAPAFPRSLGGVFFEATPTKVEQHSTSMPILYYDHYS